MKNKIIFCDIDGTILDGSRGMTKVSEKTRYAFKELKKDSYIFLASGRCRGLLDKDILNLQPSGFILCNGAYLEFNNKEIYTLSFSKESINKLKEVVYKYGGFIIFETIDEPFVDDENNPAYISFKKSWGDSLRGIVLNEMKDSYQIAMIGFTDDKYLTKVEEELKDHVDLARHNFTFSYDVNIKDINKGIGVKKILEILNIKESYCFGDGLNDLEMLQAVKYPIIMKNCNPELKKYNFEITDDVLNDGFYNYLVKNKLINEM